MTGSVGKRALRPTASIVLFAILAGCRMGPNYKRPEMASPAQYRFVEGPTEAASLADEPFWQVFADPVLQDLIREAIANNLDLVAATARVEEARAIAGISKSFLYPSINATGGYTAQQTSINAQPPQDVSGDRNFQNYDGGFTLSWELDIFGRVRRLNEAAFARFVATEQGRRGVIVTLVGDVASNYFLLRQYDYQLEIAHQTLRLNDETVAYYKVRLDGGVSNQLEVDQAVANRALTAASIPDLEQQIAITENAISVLLGRAPGPIPRGCRRSCSNGVRTSLRRRNNSSRPTPTSAQPKRSSSLPSR
jgi:multidrug efflux system outer membrane protein